MAELAAVDVWLDLNDAARYLGVHFTTLRRWADGGAVRCIRTPGGRRRFALADLQQFLTRARQVTPQEDPMNQTATLALARQHIQRQDMRQHVWFARLSDEQRARFRANGQKMVALLVQYSARSHNGDSFADEAKRLAADYGAVCCAAGLTLPETARAFQLFQRSILDSIHETASLAGGNDREGQRIYQRMADFLDMMLLATLDGFGQAKNT